MSSEGSRAAHQVLRRGEVPGAAAAQVEPDARRQVVDLSGEDGVSRRAERVQCERLLAALHPVVVLGELHREGASVGLVVERRGGDGEGTGVAGEKRDEEHCIPSKE